MTIAASPIAVAAPPMSFFISPIEAGGLMSRPPVSKQTPLPTSVTFGAPVAAPAQIEQPRRLGGGGAHRLDHRQVRRPERRGAADHRRLGAVPRRQRHEGGLERLGAHVARRRVDQRLRQRRAAGDALEPRGIDAVRTDQLGAAAALPLR